MKLVKDTNQTPVQKQQISDEKAEDAIKTIIKWIGEDPSREGLIETPRRVMKAFKEYFKGYNEDPRIKNVDYYNTMSFEDIIQFQEKHIKSKPTAITILADKKQIDMKKLEKFGEIKILKKKDILN